jgi:hypothetical protein
LLVFLPSFYSKISAKVNSAKKESILPCSLFRNGHSEQSGALPDGHEYIDGAQSKTAGAFPSTDDITSSILMSFGSSRSENPPLTPLYDFKIPFFAIDCKILARKLFGIESWFESVSLSIGAEAFDKTIRESIAYSLARVINILLLYFIFVNYIKRS